LRELLFIILLFWFLILIIYISNFPSVNGSCKYYPSFWIVTFRMVGTTSLALDINGYCTSIFF
jgi:hypothetical protein